MILCLSIVFLSDENHSLLLFIFSVFESWYIRQHRDVAKLPLEWMEKTFATTTFANGFLAIITGVVANVLADNLGHGPRVLFFVDSNMS